MNRYLQITAMLTAVLVFSPVLSYAGDATYGNLTVETNLTQTSASGTNSFMGKVGIGTTSPGTALEVVGDITLSDGADIMPSADSTTALSISKADGTDMVTFDTSQNRVYINHTNNVVSDTYPAASAFSPALQVNFNNNGGIAGYMWDTTERYGGWLFLGRSHNEVIGTHTKLSADGDVGGIFFEASDGNNFETAAGILVCADGVQGNDDVPGVMSFWTTPDGSADPLQRMTIKSTGNIGIGTISPVEKLEVAGRLYVKQPTSNSLSAIYIDTTGDADSTLQLRSKSSTGWSIGRDRTDGYNSHSLKFGFGHELFATGVVMTLLANEDVGIGTIQPSEKLHVAGTGRFDDGVTYIAALGDLSMGSYTNSP